MGQASGGWAAIRSLLLLDRLPDGTVGEADALIVDLSALAGRAMAAGVAAVAATVRTRRPAARLLVRIAPLQDGRMEAALDAAMPARPDAIVLPDPLGGPCLQRLGVALAVREAMLGLPDGSTAIVAQCGAAGLLGPPSLAGASPRLVAMMWDATRLGGDFGARSAFDEGATRTVARTLVRLAAASAGVPAFDTAADVAPQRFVEECRAARALGYAGKIAIDANQLGDIHAVFGMTPQP